MSVGLLEWIYLLPLVLTLGGALIVGLLGKVLKGRRGDIAVGIVTAVFMLLALFSVVNLFYIVMAVDSLGVAQWLPLDIWYWPPGAFDVATGAALIKIDILAVYLSVVFIFLGLFVAIYSIKYMEHDDGMGLFYPLLLTLVGSMVGVVIAGDFLTLFIFWESMSVSSYALVAFRKEKTEPVEAGLKYFLLSAFGSTLILFSMSYLYGLTGTLNLAQIGINLALLPAGGNWMNIATITMMGLIIGFGIKAAIAPLCTWLPDAHPAAPSGISAMLSGVVIMTGAYAILRLFTLFFSPTVFPLYGYIISWFALFTMIYGNLMALTQKDIKRLLAYSTITNVGYIIFGFAVGMMPLAHIGNVLVINQIRYLSITGSLFHITAHMLSKGMLFLCAGVFLHEVGTRDLDKLRGIGRKMPITMVCFAIGALSLAGVPPLIGFFSKFFIIWGSVLAGWYLATAILVLSSAFSVVYYLRMIQILIFSNPSPEALKAKRASPVMLFSIVVLTIFIVGIGLFPEFFLRVAELAAKAVLGLL